MTSKISYFKFIEADIKHRGWLAALTSVLMFLFLPVYALLFIDNMKNTASSYDTESTKEWIMNSFPGLLNGSSHRAFLVFIAGVAILCAVTGFSYLHSRDKQDFYHSMPLKRMQWFSISYLGGLIMFIVPYLFFGFCTILLGQIQGFMDRNLLILCLTSLLGGILGFLICYHTSILAMFLTGRIVTGVLASLVLLVYGSIITALFEGLTSSFFATWAGNTTAFSRQLWNGSSPIALYLHTAYATAFRSSSFAAIIGAIVCAAVMLCISILLYRHYPAEAAENALAFSKSAPIIKILIAIPTALFTGLFVMSFYTHNGETNWIIFISILAVLLLCLLIEFIYHGDLKQLFSGKISTAISIGAVIVILCILRFDLTGYDSYLPKESKITDMSVYTDNFSGYFRYPEGYEQISYDQLTAPNAAITDYAPLYTLAEIGIQNLKQGLTPRLLERDFSSSDSAVIITLRFGLSNGKDMYRRYAVDRTELLGCMEEISKNETYRKELFPVFHLDRDKILKISLQDIYKQPESLSLSKEQQNQLLDAYEKDVMNVSMTDLQYESPLGEFILDMSDKNSAKPATATTGSQSYATQLGQFYIYSTYQNTLDLLEQYGYTLRTKIEPDDVMLMIYYPNEGASDEITSNYTQHIVKDYTFGDGITLTEPEEQEQILDRICYDSCYGPLGSSAAAVGSVEITLKQKAYPNTYMVLE